MGNFVPAPKWRKIFLPITLILNKIHDWIGYYPCWGDSLKEWMFHKWDKNAPEPDITRASERRAFLETAIIEIYKSAPLGCELLSEE